MTDYAETLVFGFHVDSEGASSVDVCARVCSLEIFLLSLSLLQHYRSEFRSKPCFWFMCQLWTDWNFLELLSGDGSGG